MAVVEIYTTPYCPYCTAAKRLLARVPLFAAEFMRQEFPGVTQEQIVADATRPSRKHRH